MNDLQPYITTVVEALLGLLVAFILAGVSSVRARVETWLESRTTEHDRDTLHGLAQEGVALAESMYKAGNGPAKLQAAMEYVSKHSVILGLKLVTPETIQGAVEKVVLEYNKGKVAATLPVAYEVAEPPAEDTPPVETAEESAPVQAVETPAAQPTVNQQVEELHQKLDAVVSLLSQTNGAAGDGNANA